MKPLSLNKPHLLIMIGVPGSGKTFFADNFSNTFSAPYISSNRIRKELFNNPEFSKNEDLIITKIQSYLLEQILRTGQTAIFEGATSSRNERAIIAKKAKDSGYEPLIVWVQTEQATAKKRSLKPTDDRVALNNDQFEARYNSFINPAATEKCIVISGKHTYVSQLKIVLKKIVESQPPKQPHVEINPIRPQVSRNILIR